MKRVTTVIVNYRLKYFLEQTLRSVEEAYSYIPGETIVIDNNSGDGSIDYLEKRFPEVKFIRNTENMGFAKANNQGFALANTEFILILNPDTIIGSDTLKDCVEWMDDHSECGCIGVKMTDGNGQFLPESKRSFPSVWNSFCKLFGLSALFPKSQFFGRYALRYLSEDEVHQVDVLSGAFMFVRKDLLMSVGGFDEDFFMYGEDMDLSYRLICDGKINYYLPTPIIHYKGECTKTESIDYVRVFYQAMHIFYRKHYPNQSIIDSAFVKSAIGLRMCIQAAKNVVIQPIFKALRQSDKTSSDLYLLSDSPDEIKRILPIEGFILSDIHVLSDLKELPKPRAKQNVIIDDRKFSYNEIVRLIGKHASKQRFYHIYASASDVIISPKKQR